MKHTLTIILLLIVSAGCKGPEKDTEEDNNKIAIEWLHNHTKPIKTYYIQSESFTVRRYTFIDAKGVVFVTGWCSLSLPQGYVVTK